jgi:hypothetical protein
VICPRCGGSGRIPEVIPAEVRPAATFVKARVQPPSPPATNGARRVPPEVIMAPVPRSRSVLDALIVVDGRWRSLGELRKGDCVSAACGYRRKARDHEILADALDKVADVVGPRTVADLGEVRVRQIFERAIALDGQIHAELEAR